MLVNLLPHQSPEVDNTCFHFSSVSVRFFFSSTFSLSRAVGVQKVKLCDYWNENKKDTEMPSCRHVQEPFMHQFTQAKPLACNNCTRSNKCAMLNNFPDAGCAKLSLRQSSTLKLVMILAEFQDQDRTGQIIQRWCSHSECQQICVCVCAEQQSMQSQKIGKLHKKIHYLTSSTNVLQNPVINKFI